MSDVERMPLFAIPEGPAAALECVPRKLSWDRGGTTAQVELGKYLDHAQELAEPLISGRRQGLALRLDIGLADDVDPLHEHDLDNFLHPLTERLGAARFFSAWATKSPGARSYLRIEQAQPIGAEQGWTPWPVRTTVSTNKTLAWKTEVKAALASASELPPGPIGLQISFVVHPERAWLNLWKNGIDALDPLLGPAFPDDEFDPRDGRIVRLGLHVRESESVGWNIPLIIWTRPASLDWPEMAWFAAMTAGERAAWLSEHQRRWLPRRRSRRGTPSPAPKVDPATATPASAPSQAVQLASAPTGPHPRGGGVVSAVTELTTAEAFRAALAAGTPLVLTDSVKPPKLHRSPRHCPGIKEQYFEVKVMANRGRNGRYYAVGSEAAARVRWPGLAVCGTCG